jgi:hypothetical protein
MNASMMHDLVLEIYSAYHYSFFGAKRELDDRDAGVVTFQEDDQGGRGH